MSDSGERSDERTSQRSSNEHGSELAQLDELYNQGLLTDAERDDAVRRMSSRDSVEDGRPAGRRQMPRLVAFWPVLALLVGIGLIIFAIVGTGGGSGTTKQPGIAVNGAVVIPLKEDGAKPAGPVPPQPTFGSGSFNVGQACVTLPGFADIKEGAAVIITDASGAQVATTTLKPGVYDTQADCVFGFATAVPKKSGYSIKIAQRNPVSFSQSEIGEPQLIL